MTKRHSSAGTKGGRPRLALEPECIERLARCQLTQQEIAAILGVGRRTLERRIAEDEAMRAAYERGMAVGQASLRRQLYARAKKDSRVLIWLSKQYLGMRDSPRFELTGPDGGPIEVSGGGLTKESVEQIKRKILGFEAEAESGKEGQGTDADL